MPVSIDLELEPAASPPLTEMQRNARDLLAAAIRICDGAGLALIPGPAHLTIYVQQRGKAGRYSSVQMLDLPQIQPKPLGRNAERRGR